MCDVASGVRAYMIRCILIGRLCPIYVHVCIEEDEDEDEEDVDDDEEEDGDATSKFLRRSCARHTFL